jgi:hypothetical protein
MMYSQEHLHAEFARRIQIAQAPLDACEARFPSPSSVLDLSILDAAAKATPDIAAIAVMRDFDPVAFARSSLAFAFALPEEWRNDWFRAYTRTIFLAGNPANLEARFPFQHVTDDGSHAWLGPAPPPVAMTLRRLLVLFRSDSVLRLTNEFTVAAPLVAESEPAETPPRRYIYVGTAGLSASDYLVHLNHTLAESVLLGLIAPGSVVTIRHVPRLHSCREEMAWLRVHRDNSDASRLRAYAGVSLSG